MMNNSTTTSNKKHVLYRNQAIKAAMDLNYGEEVLKQIINANTDNEIEHIMVTARRNSFKYIY